MPDIQKHKDKKHITYEELTNFIVNNFNIDSAKKEFIEMMRTNYTNDEFQFLANHVLSDIGLRLFEKSQKNYKQYEKLLSSEATRVAELVDANFNLYD